jgi:uncharacterized protein YifN (PemK superfamily)
MALKFHPKPGTILMCNYAGFVVPEMVKRRPCIVVSPRLRHRDRLCTVVPLSKLAPSPLEAYHHEITLQRPLPAPFDAPTMWAKCDMLATVSFDRLDLIKVARRMYIQPTLPTSDIEAIRACILHALGMTP